MTKAEDTLTILCDPMTTEYGPTKPPILIAKGLIKEGYSVKVLSTTISESIQNSLESMGIFTIDLGKKFPRGDPSFVWFKAWLAEALFSMNSKKAPQLSNGVLNFSNTMALPSRAWYAQGPPTATLDNIRSFLPWPYGMVYGVISPFLRYLDKRLIQRLAGMSERLIVNSTYLADLYTKMGVEVHGVIYPPLDCDKFRPTALRPSEDYVLTYFGKETSFSLVKKVADLGVRIRSFGSKLRTVSKTVLRHRNVKMLGRVSDDELVDLYSNALFTLYPFTDEPFGYVPAESMACGTPVLTFNRQGPSESVIDGSTGWLVNSDEEFVDTALKLWKKGYPTKIRRECIRRASFFEVRDIAKKWVDLIRL